MIWLFAAVVLVLAVYHQGFRHLMYWCGGAVGLFFLLGFIVTVLR